jgi:divalent metal cation (Fe/Co/Zn/Cd) transporter
VLLGIISVILAIEMKSLLLGEGARPSDVAAIAAAITADAQVHELLHLQTQHLGPDELLVAGKVQLSPSLDFGQVVDAIDDAERRVREAVPSARVIYLEPDLPAVGPDLPVEPDRSTEGSTADPSV